MSHDIADRPFGRIAIDIMGIEGKKYLVTVDYFSNFWEVDHLPSMTTTTIIKKLKPHFVRYGIPTNIICDSAKFSSLAKNLLKLIKIGILKLR